jgi:hypothetical protein
VPVRAGINSPSVSRIAAPIFIVAAPSSGADVLFELLRNAGLMGVYPIGCTTCTGVVDEAPCSYPAPQAPQTEKICVLSRQETGGLIEVTITSY